MTIALLLSLSCYHYNINIITIIMYSIIVTIITLLFLVAQVHLYNILLSYDNTIYSIITIPITLLLLCLLFILVLLPISYHYCYY